MSETPLLLPPRKKQGSRDEVEEIQLADAKASGAAAVVRHAGWWGHWLRLHSRMYQTSLHPCQLCLIYSHNRVVCFALQICDKLLVILTMLLCGWTCLSEVLPLAVNGLERTGELMAEAELLGLEAPERLASVSWFDDSLVMGSVCRA